MQVCDRCQVPQYRRALRGKEWIGTDCGCLGKDHSADNVNSPYQGLVLEHAHDENGRPIVVNSLRDMSKAEEKYHFVHAVTSYGENYIPPDQKANTFDSGLYKNIRDRREYVTSRLVERGIDTKYLRRS